MFFSSIHLFLLYILVERKFKYEPKQGADRIDLGKDMHNDVTVIQRKSIH
jgi:hypothetical protein